MTTSLVVAGFLSLFGALEDQPEGPASAASIAATGAQDDAAPADKGPELPHWSGNVDVGIVQKQGNTESLNGNLDSKIVREAEPSRTTITSWWLYEEDSGDLTERKYGTRAKYDWFLTEKKNNYVYAIGNIGTDLSANVRTRYYVGGGVGWIWKDDETLRFSTDAGATYLHEKYRDDSDDSRGNWTFIYDLIWKFNKKISYDSDFIGQMAMDDSSDILLTWVHAISWDIGWNFRSGIRYQLDWDNSPAPGSKRDDNVLAFTLGWNFGQN